MKKLTQTEVKALRYLKAVGSVWVITTTEDFLETLTRLEKKGFVKFVQRPNCGGADAFPVEEKKS